MDGISFIWVFSSFTHKKSPSHVIFPKNFSLKIPITPGVCSMFCSLSCFYRCPNQLCKVEISIKILFFYKYCRVISTRRNTYSPRYRPVITGDYCPVFICKYSLMSATQLSHPTLELFKVRS